MASLGLARSLVLVVVGSLGAACAPDERACCTTDAECSAGASCFEGLCVPRCDDASQCHEGEACVAGVCVAPLRAPAHCPFAPKRPPRTPVVDGEDPVSDAGPDDAGPVEPPCVDAFEPNDERERAAPVVEDVSLEAAICPAEDDDWYRVPVPAGAADLSVLVRFPHTEGDLDVEVIDEGGNRVAVSQLTGDVEEIRLPVTGPRDLFVHVYGFGRATNAYTLEVSLLPPTGVCTDDALEDNDTEANPTAIATGALTSAAFCTGDPDVFTTWIGAGVPAVALLSYERGDELTLDVSAVGGGLIERSTTFSGLELVPFSLLDEAMVSLRVAGTHAHAAARSYRVGVWVADDTCGVDAFEPNSTPGEARAFLVQATVDEGFSAVQGLSCEQDIDMWRLSWRPGAPSVELQLEAVGATRAYVVREADRSLIAELAAGQSAVFVPGISVVSGQVLVVITGAGEEATYQLRGRVAAPE